jgi:hypothetical protein
MFHKKVCNILMVMVISLSLVAVSVTPPGLAQSQSNTTSEKLYSSSEIPKLSKPQALPSNLPVYAIKPTHIDTDILLDHANLLDGMNANVVISETLDSGIDHLFATNLGNGNIFDQYNHTGGLFAVNYSQAYTETMSVANPSTNEICAFLTGSKLFPSEIEPQYTDCQSNPPYIVKQIHLATVNPSSGEHSESIIGELVQVPLAINIAAGAYLYIPMGGPGGHLSLLLAGGPNTPSLDNDLPGLQAVASPWFGRVLETEAIGNYPIVPMQQAIEQYKAGFPQGVQVDAGTPVMVYYVGFPDAPQDAVMPMWTFPDATAIISDTVVNLKETTIPGVIGFAPDVTIVNPSDGDVFLRSQPVSISFDISGDQGPFTYTITADSNPILSGVTEAGTVTMNLGPLPLEAGRGEGHELSVEVVNQYHISGEDTVFLGAPAILYLPYLNRNSQGINSAYMAKSTTSSLLSPDSTLGVGVEWIMNYHNPDKNLVKTKPDAEGFYNWLGIFGWSKKFNYGDDNAWEKDWRDCTLGGGDCTYGVERVQFAYFAGHGSPAAFYFGSSKDYTGALAENARFQNVRWAAFSTCKTVRAGYYVEPGNPPLTKWFDSFKGSYMILGFHSSMKDVSFGANFAYNLYNPFYFVFPSLQPSISQAWVNTAFQMNAGKPAYLYAVGNLNPANYKLPLGNAGPLPALTGIYQFRWVWWDE